MCTIYDVIFHISEATTKAINKNNSNSNSKTWYAKRLSHVPLHTGKNVLFSVLSAFFRADGTFFLNSDIWKRKTMRKKNDGNIFWAGSYTRNTITFGCV